MRLESELQQIEQIGENNIDALLAIPSVANSQPVADRRRDVAQLEASVAMLEQRYKSKHPKMMAARAALAKQTRRCAAPRSLNLPSSGTSLSRPGLASGTWKRQTRTRNNLRSP
jgi:uncharacterized protein involved in exopolysaccharide biosynthesis